MRIGVPTNEKIFSAFQSIVGEEIILPKGTFFLPFRGYELVFARVEEIISLTRKKYLDLSFVTSDHLSDVEFPKRILVCHEFSELCRCDVSIITADEKFRDKNFVEVFSEFREERGRRPVIAARFLSLTKNFFYDKIINPEIEKVSGSEELSILLGRTDFAVARVESGKTLLVNNLFVVEKILSSCLVAVMHEGFLFNEAEKVLRTLHTPLSEEERCAEIHRRVSRMIYRGSESIH